MEKISWTDHVRNEEVLLRVKGKLKVPRNRPEGLEWGVEV
jgi:hypothetical protein